MYRYWKQGNYAKVFSNDVDYTSDIIKEITFSEYLKIILEQKINEKQVLTILTNKLDRYRTSLPDAVKTHWDTIYSKLVDCIVKELEEIPVENITFSQEELRTFYYLLNELNKDSSNIYQDFFQLLVAGHTINSQDNTKYKALIALFASFSLLNDPII